MSDGYQFGIHILFIVAIIQFVLGALAMWLFGGSSAKAEATPTVLMPDTSELEAIREKHRDDQKALEEAMQQIHQLTGTLGHDVGEHNARVKQINAELADASARGDDGLKNTLMAQIAKITEANEKLQGQLQSAEAKMAEQAQALESQMAMARTDALTGVLNRRAFDDELGRRVAEYLRYRTPVSLLLFDIDHFKKFNDTYGHQTGDEVLCHVACTLSMVMRDVDLVCRYGGEEFAVILPATELKGASLAAERARAAVERMVLDTDSGALKVTSSCGVATAMPNDDSAAIIARADQGLYASKKAGRNCVHLHDGGQLTKFGAPAIDAASTKIEKAAEKTDEATAADPLHLLPNRDAFAEEVRRRVEQHQRYHAPVTIVYAGVDAFAAITARFGREAGNVILRAVAQFMKAVLRENEMLARVADDRFALVLGGLNAQETMAKVERILNAIQKCRLPVDGLQDVRFTTSFGLAEIETGNDADVLMDRGLKAFAAASASGNCVRLESGAVCHDVEPAGTAT
jgi:diguanylate cyclase